MSIVVLVETPNQYRNSSYAIVIYYNGSVTTKWIYIVEYELSGYNQGTELYDPLITQQWYGFNDGRLCSRFTRDAVVDGAKFNFPVLFDEQIGTHIAIAQGEMLDYNRSTSISPNKTQS